MRQHNIIALVLLGVMALGCTKEIPDQVGNDGTVIPGATGDPFTLTTTVSLGGAPTSKALDATGKKTFAVGDQIAVIYKQNGGATALAVSNALTIDDIRVDGQKADITVTLENPAEDGAVRYIYPASMAMATVAADADVDSDAATIDFSKLSAQDGTLATLAESYDLAVFDGTLNGLELPGRALLSNQLAIGEFTVENWGGTAITTDLTEFAVTDGTNTYTITPASPATNLTGPVYVALLPVPDSQELTFTATDGTTDYTRSITGKALEKNNMYPVNLKMNRIVVLHEATTTDGAGHLYVAAQDGDIITGRFMKNGGWDHGYITVPDGATVTLDNASISAPGESDHAAIHCLGSAHIILNGNNNADAGYQSSYPAVLAAHNDSGIGEEYTLTISGTGSLNANSPTQSAGIGGGNGIPCGNIVITGGTIDAAVSNSSFSAGIGSGQNSSCGDITISGGNITAAGGNYSAGIGSGGAQSNSSISSCGTITISGGRVEAYGGTDGAGIGSGRARGVGSTSSCGDITISGGEVIATGAGVDPSPQYAAGIGCGYAYGVDSISSCGDITISGGTVTATGSSNAAGIGCGYAYASRSNSSCEDITISGGEVTATGGSGGAGIGSGCAQLDSSNSSCEDITITDGIDFLHAVKNNHGGGSNSICIIGYGNKGSCGTVTIADVVMDDNQMKYGDNDPIGGLYSRAGGSEWDLSKDPF